MATFTDVDTDEIRVTAQGIRRNIDEMKKLESALYDHVLSELMTCWQGEAKELFIQQFSSFNTSFTQLMGDHEALNDELEAAGGAYAQANEQITGHVNRLQ